MLLAHRLRFQNYKGNIWSEKEKSAIIDLLEANAQKLPPWIIKDLENPAINLFITIPKGSFLQNLLGMRGGSYKGLHIDELDNKAKPCITLENLSNNLWLTFCHELSHFYDRLRGLDVTEMELPRSYVSILPPLSESVSWIKASVKRTKILGWKSVEDFKLTLHNLQYPAEAELGESFAEVMAQYLVTYSKSGETEASNKIRNQYPYLGAVLLDKAIPLLEKRAGRVFEWQDKFSLLYKSVQPTLSQ